jgi:hypothetical protein
MRYRGTHVFTLSAVAAIGKAAVAASKAQKLPVRVTSKLFLDLDLKRIGGGTGHRQAEAVSVARFYSAAFLEDVLGVIVRSLPGFSLLAILIDIPSSRSLRPNRCWFSLTCLPPK